MKPRNEVSMGVFITYFKFISTRSDAVNFGLVSPTRLA